MNFFSPIILKSILITAGSGALTYCLAKLSEFNSDLKIITSNISHTEKRLDINQVLIKNTSDDLDTIKRIVNENSYSIEKLNEDLNAIKIESSNKQDENPIGNKKKNS